jgi:hypothetical protein
MKIALLNWSAGENNPLTPFNEKLKLEFEHCGRDVVIVPLNSLDSSFYQSIARLKEDGLDFAISWQGVGSGYCEPPSTHTIWDTLKVPLFCLHGDHPSQKIENHRADARYVRHLYIAGSYGRYANRYLPRKHAALTFKLPVLNTKKLNTKPEGEYFVLAKNINDVNITLEAWKLRCDPVLFNVLTSCVTSILDSLNSGGVTDHHAIVDDVLTSVGFVEKIAPLFPSLDSKAFVNTIHSSMNYMYRDAISERIILEMQDFPIHVYGRGWERYAAMNNPKHRFLPAQSAGDSENLFYSKFGILDVAPSFDCMHDRTLRAVGCGTSFLAVGSHWPHADLMGVNSDDVLFGSEMPCLKDKAESIARDPDTHLDKCRIFGSNYRRWASHFEMLRTLELLRVQFE